MVWCVLQRLLNADLILGEKLKINTPFKAHTAISGKVVGKTVHATIPKGNMGYDQCTFPGTVAVESSIVAFF